MKATRSDAQLGFGIALGDYVRGATPSEYLDRIGLQNEIFADDIRLEEIIRLPSGQISIITSQPAIKGRAATPQEIDELMSSMQFERFDEGIYYDNRRGLLLYDLHPRNVLVDEDSVPHVIDPVIQRVSTDFASFIRANTYLVNRSF